MMEVLSGKMGWLRQFDYSTFAILGALVIGAVYGISLSCQQPSEVGQIYVEQGTDGGAEESPAPTAKAELLDSEMLDQNYFWAPPPCYGQRADDVSVSRGQPEEPRRAADIMLTISSSETIQPRYVVQWRPGTAEIVFTEFRRGEYVGLNGFDTVEWRLRSLVKPVRLPSDSGYDYGIHADISPDGEMVVYTTCDFRTTTVFEEAARQSSTGDSGRYRRYFYEIALMAIDEPGVIQLTTNRYNDFFPMWSPDGRSIAFLSDPRVPPFRHGYTEVRLMSASVGEADAAYGWDDGASTYTVLRHDELEHLATDYYPSFGRYPPTWSPDGKLLAVVVGELIDARHRLFSERVPSRLWEELLYSVGVYISSARGYGLRRISGALSGVSWSPDGERLALVRTEGEEVALVTIARDGSDPEVITRLTDEEVIGEKGERDPRSHSIVPWIDPISWSPDGSHILFGCGGRVCVVTRDGERVGAWPVESVDEWGQPQAAWSPDGSRIAVYGEFDGGSISSDPSYRIVLFTMAPDGSDVRYLLGRRGDGDLDVVDASGAEGAGDVRVCAAGRVVANPNAHPELVRDCETLLRLRETLAGSAELNWWGRHDLIAWRGVAVGGRPTRVQELNLGSGRLSGTIPPELGALSGLTRLQLTRSHLHGSIPAELGRLTNLIRLNLRENNLTGEIPAELGQLINLEELYLAGNRLTGCIPRALLRVPSHDLRSLGLPDCEPG